MNLSILRGKLLISVLLGVVVFGALAAYGDFSKVGTGLQDFKWELLPLILVVTFGNYALRFVKWQYYLRLLGVSALSRRDSLMIFLAGFTMVMTPGKVGELLKSYLIRVRAGVPMTRTSPIIFAERLSDELRDLVRNGLAGVLVPSICLSQLLPPASR